MTTLGRLAVGAALSLAMLVCPAPASVAATAARPPSVALHYGKSPPIAELSVFDIVVVEPDHVSDTALARNPASRLYAYVSVGEIHPTRPYAQDLPTAWQRGVNPAWQSVLVDVAQPGYADFFSDRIVAPLWKKGYRGFFLDTLDSYTRIVAPDGQRAAQDVAMQRGLATLIEQLHQRYPGIRLIANRGFELLPSIAPRLQMLAAESLFRGYDAASGTYAEVSEADRNWLLGQLQSARDTYRLPVLAIDYVPTADRALARQTAQKIDALGIIPWVTDHALESIGIGQWEVLPRKVLMLYDGSESPVPDRALIARYAGLPLEYMGYLPDYRNLNDDLPTGPLNDRYAGIVVWPNRSGPRAAELARWLRQRMNEGTRVAFFGQFGFPIDSDLAGIGKTLGLAEARPPTGPLRIVESTAAPAPGFETRPLPARQHLLALRLTGAGQPLLTLADPRGEQYTAAAITLWGGFALDPFAVVALPGSNRSRWVVDPFSFLAQALALPPMPAPDVTTENGRRLALVHIDGDGFPSPAEFDGKPFSGAVLRDRILRRYRLPTTMSVIEAEVSPQGLYPQHANELEAIARDIFALPHVEIASHTYSHPFRWDRAEDARPGDRNEVAYHLDIPGYRFDLRREIEGSVNYIRDRLAPPGKPVGVFLWSGDAEPTANALKVAADAGLLNLNGGATLATRANPSITAISPMGVERGDLFQTFAPIMNENVYTNLWTGPFYGFENVIETFQITGAPRRLKPIGLYYHAYSASKKASLGALDRVYAWISEQSPHPIFASDYIRKVNDFRRLSIARNVTGDDRPPRFRIRSNGDLRTLRLPATLSPPDLTSAVGVAGHSWSETQADARYLHLTGGIAEIEFPLLDKPCAASLACRAPRNLQKNAPAAAVDDPSVVAAPKPFLFDANARLTTWEHAGTNVRFTLSGHRPLEFTLGNLAGCTLHEEPTVGKRPPPLNGQALPSGLTTFRLDHAAATVATRCPAR